MLFKDYEHNNVIVVNLKKFNWFDNDARLYQFKLYVRSNRLQICKCMSTEMSILPKINIFSVLIFDKRIEWMSLVDLGTNE